MEPEFPAQDVSWALFSADLKVKNMVIRRPLPSLQFDIAISSSLRFDPHGRTAPRVNLHPRKDTDAYIVDKVVLPLEPFTEPGDPRQRRLYYIIAWPDLAAARPVVDATKVLDYVSPRELENWEYKDLLRRVEEKQKAEAEAAASKKAGVPGEKKKPGRKPKNAMRAQIRPPTPELDSEEEQILARKKQGPSLSTPQKGRVLQLESELELLDSEEASVGDIDADIQLQLENEAANQGFVARYEDEEPMPLLGSNGPNYSSVGSSPPSRAGSRPVMPSSSRKVSSSVKATPVPPISQLEPKPKHTQAMRAASNHKATSSTPVPLPFQPPFPPPKQGPSSAQKAVIPLRNEPNSRLSGHSNPNSSKPLIKSTTLQSGTSPSHSPTPESSGGFVPANSFTPLGGHFPRPSKRPAEDSIEGGDSTETTPSAARRKKGRKKKQPRLSQPRAEPEVKDEAALTKEAEPEYVVKRLEGDEIVDGVHWFKVRWEGEWPADQNPTWEPQDNISSVLVKKYLKQKAEREAAKSHKNHETPKNKPTPGGKQQQTLAHWARKYASVSEAFEGKAELDLTSGRSNGTEGGDGLQDEAGHEANDDDDTEAMNELLVVDDSQGRLHEETAAERARQLSAQVAAQFASLTPGRRTQF